MTSDTVRIGMRVQIDNTWARVYRRPGTAVEGVLVAISPTGAVVTVRLDSLADSYVRVEHVKPAVPSSTAHLFELRHLGALATRLPGV
jgi:hypothetical protein